MNKFIGVLIVLALFSARVFAGNLPDAILHMPIPLIAGGNTSLADYRNKYSIHYPLAVDKSYRLFYQYSVKKFSTLLLIKNGRVIQKVTRFGDEGKLNKLMYDIQ